MSLDKPWIQITPAIEAGVSVINRLDAKKFKHLLNRIVLDLSQNLHSNEPFTRDQLVKLLLSLSVTEEELKTLLSTCILLFRQALHNITSTENFRKELTDLLKLDEDKVAIYCEIWTNNAKQLLKKALHHSVCPRTLEDVSNIEVPNESEVKEAVPKSVLQFQIKEQEVNTDLIVELDEKDLVNMFNCVENIQEALDALS